MNFINFFLPVPLDDAFLRILFYLFDFCTPSGGARRGRTGRACDADVVRYGTARPGRSRQGEETSGCQRVTRGRNP